MKAPRLGEVLSGLGGAATLGSLWMPWYQGPAGELTGWQALGVLDVLLFLLGLVGLLIVVTQVTPPGYALTVAACGIGLTLGLVTVFWTVVRVLSPPDGGATIEWAWLGLAGAAVVLVGCFAALRDEGTSFFPGVEEPAPPPATGP